MAYRLTTNFTIALAFDNDAAGHEATMRANEKIEEAERWFWSLKTSRSWEDRQLFWWHVILWCEPTCFTETFLTVDKWIQEEMDFRHKCKEWEREWSQNLDEYLRNS